ncbi:MAG: ATP-binding protein, partial [Gemmatimonadota bacterium]|nr:ATP-binding protein [Gemmatimonadota bacterium]
RLVEIDEGQISQVINNLIINAVQAMPEGGTIKITVENIDLETSLPVEHGEYVKITVKDSGCGISEKYLTKIFDPYFTTKQQGSGLGLATSYSIIRKHGGHIDVKSQVGVGTSFHIFLPVSDKQVPVNQEVKEDAVIARGKILVMDDEAGVRDVACRLLMLLGQEVDSAADGAEAIEMYIKAGESGRPYDIVIIDLTIPGGMGGKEAVGKLLEIDPGVKAIVSSGYSNDPVLSEFKKYGFCGMVSKPYKIEEMKELLNNIMAS